MAQFPNPVDRRTAAVKRELAPLYERRTAMLLAGDDTTAIDAEIATLESELSSKMAGSSDVTCYKCGVTIDFADCPPLIGVNCRYTANGEGGYGSAEMFYPEGTRQIILCETDNDLLDAHFAEMEEDV